MKVVVFNLGCKVNQYECDVIAEKLTKMGFEVFDYLINADLYIINTCAVTSEAEKKSRQAIARCKKYNSDAKIFVCGCASEKTPEAFVKENVVYIKGVADKTKILDYINLPIEKSVISIAPLPLVYENCELSFPKRTRAYLKIQDGCNNFCTYCIIPYLRGRSRSRPIDAIVSEAEILAENTEEIVLTGINLSQYGEDIGVDLATLIRALKNIDTRIRLGSFYVEIVDKELLDALFGLKHFCPHFHLSLQSGSERVLKSMNRHYSPDEFVEKIKLIRSYDENACITTDVIVGFPTETDECFKETKEFLNKVCFSDIHVFPYSPREGTVAHKLNKLSDDIVRKRKEELLKIKDDLRLSYYTKNIGIEQSVLIENTENDMFFGYSDYYIKIYTKKKDEKIISIVPKEIYKDGLKGD